MVVQRPIQVRERPSVVDAILRRVQREVGKTSGRVWNRQSFIDS